MANKRIEEAIESALLASLAGHMEEDEIENLDRRIKLARDLAPEDSDD